MDDINLIRTVLTEEREDGRAAARLRLQQVIAAERGGRVPGKRWLWPLAGTGLVAAAAAVAVVLGAAAP
ncbi:MAG TPA: hypothetical protein VGP31_12620, partial [Planosporangium sp.]|nr:hypothetical protein [Planosporangium sp.]